MQPVYLAGRTAARRLQPARQGYEPAHQCSGAPFGYSHTAAGDGRAVEFVFDEQPLGIAVCALEVPSGARDLRWRWHRLEDFGTPNPAPFPR